MDLYETLYTKFAESIEKGLSDANSNLFIVTKSSSLEDKLFEMWHPQEFALRELKKKAKKIYRDFIRTYQKPSPGGEIDLPSFLRSASWDLRISNEFKKETRFLDRKLQGQIFVAIQEIIDAPMTLKGDTVKPLSGTFKGLWRYRIGDHRLIYRPDKERQRIELITFNCRGTIYE